MAIRCDGLPRMFLRSVSRLTEDDGIDEMSRIRREYTYAGTVARSRPCSGQGKTANSASTAAAARAAHSVLLVVAPHPHTPSRRATTVRRRSAPA